MKKLITLMLAVGLSLSMAGVYADDMMKKDDMNKDGTMMKKDDMGKDGMKKPAKKHKKMMKKHNRGKSDMKKDEMMKDGMGKEEMEK